MLYAVGIPNTAIYYYVWHFRGRREVWNDKKKHASRSFISCWCTLSLFFITILRGALILLVQMYKVCRETQHEVFSNLIRHVIIIIHSYVCMRYLFTLHIYMCVVWKNTLLPITFYFQKHMRSTRYDESHLSREVTGQIFDSVRLFVWTVHGF